MTKKEIRIKGFDKDLKCRGMQFEIGKEYKLDTTELKLCTNTVFHYCKTLKQANGYYPVQRASRYCYIEVLGEEIEDDDKCGSNHIKIVREILGEELDILLGRVSGNTGIFNNGKYNTGDRNTGDRNTGHFNTGHWNSGHNNTGHWNSGDWNTGHNNTGHWNTGNDNTGNWNTGSSNTGDFNTCNSSSGFFCTQDPKAIIFNIETDMTVTEFRQSKYYNSLMSVPFVLVESKNDEVIKHSYKDACAKWWEKMTPINREVVKSIPNFDAKIFEEITGIKV